MGHALIGQQPGQFPPMGGRPRLGRVRGKGMQGDDGPGVPPEVGDRVFDMFFSGSNRAADSRRSLGLGLALCRSIITAHGGTISLSQNQPHGAVFRFTLPAEEVQWHE